MTEFIRNTPELIFVTLFLTIILGLRLGYIGMKYDDAMLKVNPKYKGYNFIRIGKRRGGLIIPHKLLDFTNSLSIDKYVQKYNRLLKTIWTILILTLAIWFIQHT